LGYATWYSVLPALKATNAATVQLSVPIFAAFGGIVILGESVTVRLFFASFAILGGIALVILSKSHYNGAQPSRQPGMGRESRARRQEPGDDTEPGNT
jgi:drug/metabolite transporter (DMT)-like permease